MIGMGILDGDLVVMQKRDPVPGDIVAALVDETSSTLKVYVREKGVTILRGANPRVKDITATRLESQGVMVGLMRAMKRAA
jgi:repressor LexA